MTADQLLKQDASIKIQTMRWKDYKQFTSAQNKHFIQGVNMKKLLLLLAALGILASAFAVTYFTEGFEAPFAGTPPAPPGWTQTMNRPIWHATNEKDWLQNFWNGSAWAYTGGTIPATGPYQGSGVLWIDDYNYNSSSTPQNSRRMESPIVNLTASTSPYLRFWYFNNQGVGITLNLRVVVSGNGGATWDLLTPIVNGFTTTNLTWNQISVAIPNEYRTGSFKFGFELTNRWGTSNPFIDEVSVEDYLPPTIVSAQSGDWNAAATWVGGIVPTANNNVQIVAGHTVTVTNATSTTGIIARCQNLLIDGILNHGAGTANLLHAFGNIVVNGSLNAFNGTSGRTVYLGGSFTVNASGTANFSISTTMQSTGSTTISTGASQLVFLNNQPATFQNSGTLVAGRVNNILHIDSPRAAGSFTYESPISVPYTFGLHLGTVNPNGNLTLGNAPSATIQDIERANGSFLSNPIWDNTNITARNNYYYSPNWVPLTQTVIIAGDEIELIEDSIRLVSGTLTMNTHNNLLLNYPLTVGTATTGGWMLNRGIIIANSTNVLRTTAYVTSSPGTAPSTATPPTTHGSYVAGSVRRDWASTTANRTFPLGVGVDFNGGAPNANVLKTLTIAPGTAANQSPTVSITGAPSGAVNSPLTTVLGPRGYRIDLNGGPDFPATATFTMPGMNYSYGNSDNLLGTPAQLRIAQAPALTGPWTERSVSSTTGTLAAGLTRTTATAAPGPIGPLATYGEYFAWATTLTLDPVFEISPVTRDFGNRQTGTTETQVFTITNTGGTDLLISSIALNGSYGSQYTPLDFGVPRTVISGGTTTVSVRFNPTAVGGPYDMTLDIAHNATGSPFSGAITGYGVDYTISTFPYDQSFDDATFAPPGWTNIKTAGTGNPGIWDRQTAGTYPTCSPHSGAAMARYNCYNLSSGTKGELITPPVAIPASGAYRMKFWMYRDSGFTTYNLEVVNVYVNSTPTSAGGTLLGTISRYYGFAPVELISNQWYQYGFDLPVQATNEPRFLIFKAVSQYGNNIFIDDIRIEACPTTPVVSVSPPSWDFGTVVINTINPKVFSITNLGVGYLNLSSVAIDPPSGTFYSVTRAPALLPLGPGESTTFEVTYAPTAVGNPHAANVKILSNVDPYLVPLTGICVDPRISSLSHYQYFDSVTAPALPLGWTAYRSSTSMTLNSSTTYSQSTPNSIYMSNSSITTGQLQLISPQILLPMNTIRLKFYARSGSAGPTLQVGTINALDGTGTFNLLATLTLTAGFVQYSVSLANYFGPDQYICFRHGMGATYQSIYIDNFQLDQLLANDLAATALNGPTLGVVNVTMSFYVTVTNYGTDSQPSYNVYLKRYGDDRLVTILVNSPIAPDATVVHMIKWTPPATGVYNLVGEVELTGDAYADNNESSPPTLVTIHAATNYTPLVGDPLTTTKGWTLPLQMYYKNSVTETIYTSTEMQMTAGIIQGVAYFNNFTQDFLGKPVKIWAKNTTVTDLYDGWLDFAGYELVFDGVLNFPSGSNTIYIPFSPPIAYTGGNFALRVNRPMDTEWFPNTNVFYYTMPKYVPSRSRYLSSDSSTYDPTGALTGGTLQDIIPNTMFLVSEASPVVLLPALIRSITKVGDDFVLNWDNVPGAYAYRIFKKNFPIGDWPLEPFAVVWDTTFTYTPQPNEWRNFFKVVAVSSYRNDNTGLSLDLTGQSSPDPLKVKIVPAICYTINKD